MSFSARLGAGAAAFLLLAGAAHAEATLAKGVTRVQLAAPLVKAIDPVIDGRIWHCEGDACQANPMPGSRAQSLQRECEAAARTIGAFQTYQTGPEELAADKLARCNTQARAPRAEPQLQLQARAAR